MSMYVLKKISDRLSHSSIIGLIFANLIAHTSAISEIMLSNRSDQICRNSLYINSMFRAAMAAHSVSLSSRLILHREGPVRPWICWLLVSCSSIFASLSKYKIKNKTQCLYVVFVTHNYMLVQVLLNLQLRNLFKILIFRMGVKDFIPGNI